MNITSDQLSYILERKFIGIRPGIDFVVVQTITRDRNAPDGFVSNNDGHIRDWYLENIPQPSEEELERMWSVLEDQYHSDPNRPDSEMFLYLTSKQQPSWKIVVNEDI